MEVFDGDVDEQSPRQATMSNDFLQIAQRMAHLRSQLQRQIKQFGTKRKYSSVVAENNALSTTTTTTSSEISDSKSRCNTGGVTMTSVEVNNKRMKQQSQSDRMFHPFEYNFLDVANESYRTLLIEFQRKLAELMLDYPPLTACPMRLTTDAQDRFSHAFVPSHICYALPSNRFQDLDTMVSNICRSTDFKNVVFPFWNMLLHSREMRCTMALIRTLSVCTPRLSVKTYFSLYPTAHEELTDIVLVHECFRPMRRVVKAFGSKKKVEDILPMLAQAEPVLFLLRTLQVYRSMVRAKTNISHLHRDKFIEMYGHSMVDWKHSELLMQTVRVIGRIHKVRGLVSTQQRLLSLWLEITRLAQWRTRQTSWNDFLIEIVNAVRHLSLCAIDVTRAPSVTTFGLHVHFREQGIHLRQLCTNSQDEEWSSNCHRRLVTLLATFCNDTADVLCRTEPPWSFTWNTLRVIQVEPCAPFVHNMERSLFALTVDTDKHNHNSTTTTSDASAVASLIARQNEYEQHTSTTKVQQWSQSLWHKLQRPLIVTSGPIESNIPDSEGLVASMPMKPSTFVMPSPCTLAQSTSSTTTDLSAVSYSDDDAYSRIVASTSTTNQKTPVVAFPLEDAFKTPITVVEWQACEDLQYAVRHVRGFIAQQPELDLLSTELEVCRSLMDNALQSMDLWLTESEQSMLGYFKFGQITPARFRNMPAADAEKVLMYLIHNIMPMWIPTRLFIIAGMEQLLSSWKSVATADVIRWRQAWHMSLCKSNFLTNCLVLCSGQTSGDLFRYNTTGSNSSSTTSGSLDFAHPLQSLVSALRHSGILWPEMLETRCWTCLQHRIFKVQGVSESLARGRVPTVALTVTIDRSDIVASVLSGLERVLSLTIGQTRVLSFKFKDEIGSGDGVHLEGLRIATQTLYTHSLANGWLEESHQPGILWSSTITDESQTDLIERSKILLILGTLQAECLVLGLRLPQTMLPTYLLYSATSTTTGGEDALLALKRYDPVLTTSMQRLKLLSTADLAELELDWRQTVTSNNICEYVQECAMNRLRCDRDFVRGVLMRLLIPRMLQHPWMISQTHATLEHALVELRDTSAYFRRLAAAGTRTVTYLGCTRTTTAVQWFWEIVTAWTMEQETLRRHLLTFWTSKSSPLLINNGEDKPLRIQLESSVIDNADARHPWSHTCISQLELPRFTSKEIMEKRLLSAIQPENTQGFGIG